jgi:hypothetical protein
VRKERRYSEKSDKNGVIIFNDIPVDMYRVEVKECNDYQGE